MVDARLLGYAALAFVLFLIYDAWVQDYGPKPEPIDSSAQYDTAPAQALPGSAPQQSQKNQDLPQISGFQNEVRPSSQGSKTITVKTDVLLLEIDTQGGNVVRADLLKYPIDINSPEEVVTILSSRELFYVAQSGLQSSDGNAPDHYALYDAVQTRYELAEEADELQVPLIWRNSSGVTVTKVFTLKRDSYAIDVDYKIENGSDKPWQVSQYRQLQRNYKEIKKSRFIYTYTGGVIYSEENKYEKIDFDEMVEDPLDRRFAGGWAAIIQHYFLSAWIPNPDEQTRYYSRGIETRGGQNYIIGMSSPVRNIAPGEKAELESQLFIGPKLQEQLKATANGLELTVDYGLLTIISQPLFWLLSKINTYVNNWGWSIILVTLLIKAAFYKLAETSYRSMARMRQVQPKIMKLRERYANDRQRQGQAMMELYKKEKINPLGGCLPMLIQIPVFIALYWVLLESVEMRQAPFILWIKDLSIKDPYYVLPLIMGVTMYIQQKLSPAPVDPIQAKVFMILPFVFTFFFAFFPAGLVLYWVVNNTLTIAQQWVITRRVMQQE